MTRAQLAFGRTTTFLEAYGIRLSGRLAGNLDEALSLADDLGYPVVLKAVSSSVVHKTDVGGVALDLKNEADLLAAYGTMRKTFADEKPGYLLQPYLAAGKEVILGLMGNAGLAPTVMFGLGGVFVETLKDVQFRLAPLSGEEALEMIQSIKGYGLLEGTRGEKPRDIEALVEMLTRFSQLGTDFPEIAEADLNPALVFEKGKGAVVVDARIKTGS